MKEISICFVGSDSEIDKSMSKCSDSCSHLLHARGHAACQWLAVLKVANCKHDNIILPGLKKLQNFLID